MHYLKQVNLDGVIYRCGAYQGRLEMWYMREINGKRELISKAEYLLETTYKKPQLFPLPDELWQ